MVDRLSATPLIALDAVVIDTETTDLEPARARILEIAGIRLHGGRIEDAEPIRTLVDPGESIPALSTKVHGIDAARVAGAPRFPVAWQALGPMLADAVVIGHNVGYDLAVLGRECVRAGIAFRKPRSLCVRMLAEVARPDLAGYSLEELADWLGVTIEGRHSALGDARATAHLFLNLVPVLREGGIRTLAEAEAAIHLLSEVIADQHRAGWSEPAQLPGSAGERAFARIDSYPYRHRVRDVMSEPPVFVRPTTALSEALRLLMQLKISSVFVTPDKADPDGRHRASDIGILTERDILRALDSGGTSALTRQAGAFASKPLAAVPAEAFVYLAIGRMDRRKIRHLGVTDDAGYLVGALSARRLLRLRAQDAVNLDGEIDEAGNVRQLGRAWAKLAAVARGLLDEEVEARGVAAVISRELAALTRRAGEIAEMQMREAGRGAPPVPYALLVLGSAGRGESLLALDQDNAIVFAEGAPDGPEDRWFAELGTKVADILHEVGVPYCKGGVMAMNREWRGSATTWRERVQDWVGRSRPEDLLSVDIFFDFRAVHGESALGAELWRYAYEQAGERVDFIKLLAEAGGTFQPPLGWFGIRTDDGRVDLKMGGLFKIVTAARVLAIRYRVAEHSTLARLEGVKAAMPASARDIDALIAAHGVLVGCVLEQQLVDIAAGRPPSSKVELKRLGREQRTRLKEALQALAYADEMVRDLLI